MHCSPSRCFIAITHGWGGCLRRKPPQRLRRRSYGENCNDPVNGGAKGDGKAHKNQKLLTKSPAHRVDAVVFFWPLRRPSDDGFGFWRGPFGAAGVNRKLLWRRRILLHFSCQGRDAARIPGKFCGAGRLEFNRSAPTEPAPVNHGATQLSASISYCFNEKIQACHSATAFWRFLNS